MKKMSATHVKELHCKYDERKKTDEEIEMEGLSKAKEAIEKRLAFYFNVSEKM